MQKNRKKEKAETERMYNIKVKMAEWLEKNKPGCKRERRKESILSRTVGLKEECRAN